MQQNQEKIKKKKNPTTKWLILPKLDKTTSMALMHESIEPRYQALSAFKADDTSRYAVS